ncbi:MAG: Aldose 1-epimerase [Clostridia bacterium]|jgi:aldose 1-epimerase|nr:Aldose 1-epimerase [Clostridia bacterium]
MFTTKRKRLRGFEIWQVQGKMDNGRSIEVWINASHGMNMCKLVIDHYTLIEWDVGRCLKGQSYGTPILYPTPNRVKNDQFTFRDTIYNMKMHGIIRFTPCKIIIDEENNDCVRLKGSFEFREGRELHALFPIESELCILFTITHKSIEISYELTNQSAKELPYGFALHPFFQKIGRTLIKVCATQVMGMNAEKLPTGEVHEVKGTSYDLADYRSLEGLYFDHVYTAVKRNPSASIWYQDISLKVHMEASSEFSHIVVYSPKGQNFFCIENQSCSTNAHNLYAQGFHELSGLEIIAPHHKAQGHIKYTFENESCLK